MHDQRVANPSRAAEAEPLRNPRALLIDLDDTLLDSAGFAEAVRQTCDEVARKFAGFDAERLLEANTQAWNDYWPEVERLGWLGKLDWEAVGPEVWRRTIHASGSDDDSIVLFTSERFEQLSQEKLRPFADVGNFLAIVAERELPLGLVTNGPATLQRDKLRALGIDGAFDTVVISGEIGIAKPDAAPFLLAVERLDTDPRYVWHLGDSLATDVVGAKAAGLTAVWLNRRDHVPLDGDPIPDLEIASLDQLIGYLRHP
jgi:putative hydrolase of the HAD superfamily